MIIRARERKDSQGHVSHFLSRAYESCFACRTLISTELNRSLFRSAFVK